MLVDSHCHINCLKGATEPAVDTAVDKIPKNNSAINLPETTAQKQTIQTYLNDAKNAGVGHFLCVSIDWETYPQVLDIAEDHDNVFASVGVHPNHDEGHEPTVDELLEKATNTNIVAIGETGLDYFRTTGDVEWQRERFRRHIQAAKQCNKPLIIHTREAREDTIKILQEEDAKQARGVMHCFTETWEMAQAAMEMDFYISLSGIVTFKSAKELQEVAKKVPLDRLLVETDSPYLAPVPFRGKQNQPAYVKYVAEFVAELRGISVQELTEQTTKNFFQLFNSARPVN